MTEMVVITGATRHATLQSNRHHQQTNAQLFTGRMPFLFPNCIKELKRESTTFQGLAYPKLNWGLPSLSRPKRLLAAKREGLPSLSSAL